jgi:hypothetical protein
MFREQEKALENLIKKVDKDALQQLISSDDSPNTI